MKRLISIAILLLTAITLRGQIVMKTDFEKACETTGILYTVDYKDIGKVSVSLTQNNYTSTIIFVLNSFSLDGSEDKIQSFSAYQNWKTPNSSELFSLNCSEIDELVRVVSKILENKSLIYNAKTSNLKISGCDREGYVKLTVPTEKSTPRHLDFPDFGCLIDGSAFIEILNRVKDNL